MCKLYVLIAKMDYSSPTKETVLKLMHYVLRTFKKNIDYLNKSAREHPRRRWLKKASLGMIFQRAVTYLFNINGPSRKLDRGRRIGGQHD